MTENDFAVMALVLGLSCLGAALAGYRIGNDRRDVALMVGAGAALGAVSLVLSPSTWI